MLAIVGPTASGKSALALRIARARQGEIVSCDSMQIYRGLDVGTAKPSAEERALVPHHLIDVVEPDQPFSAARYAELADRAIAEIRGRGREPIVCGGTGLYLRALRFGLVEAPPRDEALRARLTDEERRAPGSLHARLAKIDAASAQRIAPRDLVRIIRALEVFELTGTPLSALKAAQAPGERQPMQVAVLSPPKQILDERIAARARAMLASGLIDETRRAIARFGRELPALHAVGYREVLDLLDGKVAEHELEGAIVRSTRHYARRQRTWFHKEPDARRFAEEASLLSACAPEAIALR